MSEPAPMYRFDGGTFSSRHDGPRLASQMDRVRALMADGRWRTLAEVQRAIAVPGKHDTEAAISARLRDLRKGKFGALHVERRRRGEPSQGLWEYRVVEG